MHFLQNIFFRLSFLLSLSACVHGSGLNLSDGALLDLQSMKAKPASLRSAAELDLNKDGEIDTKDLKIAQSIEAAYQRTADSLVNKGISRSEFKKMYTGPKPENSLFLGLRKDRTGPRVTTKVVESAAAEVMIGAVESRWLAEQIRIADALELKVSGPGLRHAADFLFPSWEAPQHRSAAGFCEQIIRAQWSSWPAGISKVMVSDLDSTVWWGNVMDPFLAALAASDKITPAGFSSLEDLLSKAPAFDPVQVKAQSFRENMQMFLEAYAHGDEGLPGAGDIFFAIVGMMEGLSPKTAQSLARVAFESGSGQFSAWNDKRFIDSQSGCGMKRIIELLQDQGVEVYLLSATLDFLAQEAGRQLGVSQDRVMGSALEIREGRYTGEVAASTYENKGAIVRQWLPAPPIMAFGDSARSDFLMLLEAIGPSWMVNPAEKLIMRNKAEGEGLLWPLHFDETEGGSPVR